MTIDDAAAQPAAPPLCALHPDLPSAGTCARCGRFACEQCFRPDTGLCAECELRTADPLGVAGPFSIGRVLASGWKLFRTAPWTALAISIAEAPLSIATTFVALSLRGLSTDYPLLSSAPAFGVGVARGVLFDTFLRGILLARMVGTARGEPLSFLQGIGRSARAWPRLMWAALVTAVLTTLGMLACVLPGLYASVTLALIMPVAYLEPDNPAAETSAELTQGRRWELLGALLLMRIPTMILAVLRVVSAQVLMQQLELPMEQRTMLLSASRLGIELINGLVEGFVVACILAAYLQLRARANATLTA